MSDRKQTSKRRTVTYLKARLCRYPNGDVLLDCSCTASGTRFYISHRYAPHVTAAGVALSLGEVLANLEAGEGLQDLGLLGCTEADRVDEEMRMRSLDD